MSLISDALQKAQPPQTPGSHPPPTPPAPPSWKALGLLAALLVLVAYWAWPAQPASRQRAVFKRSTPRPSALKPIMTLLPATPVNPSLAWRVDGVITGMGTPPTAIINGKAVAEGDAVWGGARVVSVNRERVELLHEGAVITLPLDSRKR